MSECLKLLNFGKCNAACAIASEQRCQLGTRQIHLVMSTSVTFTGVSTASVMCQVIIQNTVHAIYAWKWEKMETIPFFLYLMM
jgi:hypothetical protein